jgi:hypothetical protein
MPGALYDRVNVSTTTTGTGTITLGSAVAGYQTFAQASIASGASVRYVITDGSNWEIGTGTYTSSGTTLTRGPTESSNSGSAISLDGSATVFIAATAADLTSNVAITGGTINNVSSLSAKGTTAGTGTVTILGVINSTETAVAFEVLDNNVVYTQFNTLDDGAGDIGAGRYLYSSAATVAAAGSTLATATALTHQYNAITSGASTAGVALPNFSGGAISVYNTLANAINVYPYATGGKINALGTGAAYSLAASTVARFVGFTSNGTIVTQYYLA